mgnify:CR=1 FL=1
MARPIVGNPFENQIPTVSPTASPVDIYVRPAEKTNPFAALADSLSRLERKAVPIFKEEEKRRADAEFAEGQELYAKTRKSIGDAVKAGIIKQGESPYLRKGYRIANLNVLSARYAAELNEALVARKLFKNGNPAAIEQFTEKFYADFQEKYDFDGFATTEVADYFLSTASKANEAFRESWKSKHLAYQEDQNYLAFQNEVGTYINSSFLETDSPEARAVKMDSLGKWVTNKAKEAAVDGMDMSKINQNIIDSVVLSAYEMNDEGILDVLDTIATGTGILGGTAAARKAAFDAKTGIATLKQQADDAAAKALAAQQKQQIGNILQDGIQASFDARTGNAGSTKTFGAAIVELGKIGTPEAFSKQTSLTAFYDKMTEEGEDERNVSNIDYAEVQSELVEIDDEGEVLDLLTSAMVDGRIDKGSSTTLFGLWQNLNKEDPPIKEDFFNNATGVPQVLADFINTVSSTPLDQMTQADTELVRRAKNDFFQMYADALRENEGDVPIDQLENRIKRRIAQQVVKELQEIYTSVEAISGADEALNEIAIEKETLKLIEQIEKQQTSTSTAVPNF